MTLYWTGVGSRHNVPPDILKRMAKYSSILEGWGYILRTGDALGCDKAFSQGVKNSKNKIVLRSIDAQPWGFEYVRHCLPIDRPPYDDPTGYIGWDPYVRGLLARNMQQVLGDDGKTPSKFLACWTPEGDYNTSKVGGTGYAIRCALKNNIPVYNFVYPDQIKLFEEMLRNILSEIKTEKNFT